MNLLFGEIKEEIDELKKRPKKRCREENESSVHKGAQEGESVRKKRSTEQSRNGDCCYIKDDI